MTTAITLPEGYSQDPFEAQARDAVPGYQLYGGADISRASDADGVLHVGCCARGPDGDFRFRVFRYSGNVATDIPLQVRASGRGEISVDQYTGQMVWIAWEHSVFYTAPVPGAAPFLTPDAPHTGVYTPLQPNAYSPAIDGQTFSGGRSLDMAVYFGVPDGCRAYNVRLVAQAASPNIRARLGSEQQPGQLTVNTQAAGLQIHQVGIVNASPSGALWMSVVDGNGQEASARVWLQVAGYWV